MAFVSLKKRADFLRARSGKRWSSGRFTLQRRQRGDLTQAVRIGFTVTKKVGNAVERNRIKRRLRAACREIPADGWDQGSDYVLIARRAALTCSFTRLLDDLERGLVSLRSKKKQN